MKIAKNWLRNDASAIVHQISNKVPEITLYFWIIKIFCTTVGETAADFLNANLHLGLTGTTFVMGSLLSITLFFQFASRRYVPGVYWFAVVLISVVGTLITDNLTDNFGVSLETTTIIFSVALATTFAAWYASERTLSVHTIYTIRREVFYWLAILFTFALGTAAGDLTAEKLNLGYVVSVILFGSLIAVVTVAHLRFKLNAVLAFWIAYILTRPLGASLGDYLTQPNNNGGLGLGTILTSTLFLITILITVTYLTITKKDAAPTMGKSQPLPLSDDRSKGSIHTHGWGNAEPLKQAHKDPQGLSPLKSYDMPPTSFAHTNDSEEILAQIGNTAMPKTTEIVESLVGKDRIQKKMWPKPTKKAENR